MIGHSNRFAMVALCALVASAAAGTAIEAVSAQAAGNGAKRGLLGRVLGWGRKG